MAKTIPDKIYFRIGEVADIVGVKPYVLRYWETEFPDILPVKSKSGQRLYKRRDVETLQAIKHLLYDEKFTINGARQHLKETMKGTKEEAAPAKAVPVHVPKAGVGTKKTLLKIKSDLAWCLGELRKS